MFNIRRYCEYIAFFEVVQSPINHKVTRTASDYHNLLWLMAVGSDVSSPTMA